MTAPPPPLRAKMCAMPRASEGAPPVRKKSVSLADFARRAAPSAPTLTGKPQPEMVATAAAGVAPTMPAGEFTAK